MLSRALFKAAETFAPKFGTALESEPRKPLPNSDRFIQNQELNSTRKGDLRFVNTLLNFTEKLL